MRPHTLDEMSTIILIFCRDGANKIELIEKCYLNDIEVAFSVSPMAYKAHILITKASGVNV